MLSSRKKKAIARILAAAGIVMHGAVSADAAALARAIESRSPAAMNDFIRHHSDSPYVGDAILHMAKGGPFKSPGDHGRPPIFGPPGKPVIGHPGHHFHHHHHGHGQYDD